MKRILALTALTGLLSLPAAAQFSHADTLRGSLNAERNWWDVRHYAISVTPDFTNKEISGAVTIRFYVTGKPQTNMQIDLQQPMVIDKAEFFAAAGAQGTPLTVAKKDINVWYADFTGQAMKPGIEYRLHIHYHGKPREAVRPPWDGGWIWKKDKKGSPWMSVACQSLGASVWYPCKDHQSDEPEKGATLTMTVPDSLTGVGNGRLTEKKALGNGLTSYTWTVIAPINNYCIIPYIGKYVSFGEMYTGEKGPLSMNYWVLNYNLDKAKKQFTDAPRMMKAFEHWFGPYPFYEDGYQLVESPHLGMEHQSATAYGNGYVNGYSGSDLSGTGWGLKWDFIIIHESGHEWFANSITTADIADMWVHEGFTNYSETLFTDYYYGKEAGNDYLAGVRKNIANDKPIIGPYGVNEEGSSDMYSKGANMLHCIRQLVNNDEKFRQLLRKMNRQFFQSVITSQQAEAFMSKETGIDLSKIFDQYLRTTKVPRLMYKVNKNVLSYRWMNCVSGFDMPVKVWVDSVARMIYPSADVTKTTKLPPRGNNMVKVDRNFYIETGKL